jgi:hypothetical protein
MRHTQRLEDVFGHVVVERPPGDAFHDIAGKGSPVVGIGRRGSRWKDALRNMGNQMLPQCGLRCGLFGDQVLDLLLETRSMRHEVAECNGFAESRRNLEIQILVDVAVQIELALLHQLHYSGPCKELGDRPGAEERGVHGDRRFLVHIAIAVTLGKEDGAIFHYQHHGARDVLAFQLHGDKAVKKGMNVSHGELVWGLGYPGFASGRLLRRRWNGRWLGRLRCSWRCEQGELQRHR